mgnify:CR=1 FL=1
MNFNLDYHRAWRQNRPSYSEKEAIDAAGGVVLSKWGGTHWRVQGAALGKTRGRDAHQIWWAERVKPGTGNVSRLPLWQQSLLAS